MNFPALDTFGLCGTVQESGKAFFTRTAARVTEAARVRPLSRNGGTRAANRDKVSIFFAGRIWQDLYNNQ